MQLPSIYSQQASGPNLFWWLQEKNQQLPSAYLQSTDAAGEQMQIVGSDDLAGRTNNCLHNSRVSLLLHGRDF
jgi:hypothetical protein